MRASSARHTRVSGRGNGHPGTGKGSVPGGGTPPCRAPTVTNARHRRPRPRLSRKKPDRTHYPEPVALPIDSSRPFLSSSELHDLAAAVRDAGVHDESRWIEWKKTLDDLNGPSARIHIVKAIQGFANRDPDMAARRAGGFAYLLVGVEPGNVRGVTTVDHNTLEQSLEPYISPHVRWTSEYIKLDDKDILVIVVDPPRAGDPIHYLRKGLKAGNDRLVHAEHLVFVRRNARTVKANDWDMTRLQERSVHSVANVAPPYHEVDRLTSRVHSHNPASQRNSLAMLEQIGVDHARMRQLVIDTICQLLRNADDTVSVELREFAQAILTRRLTGLDATNEPVDDGGAWENIDIDLTGARLTNLNWQAGSIGIAILQGAEFVGDTHIGGLEFYHLADFSGCTFNDFTAIVDTTFDSCDFSGATFQDDCTFSGSKVNGVANFTNTVFAEDATFRKATFGDIAIFKELSFEANTIFEGASFHGDTYFDRSHFEGIASFVGAKFYKVTSFRGVTSRDEFDFTRACTFSNLRTELPPEWSVNPYASCVAIARVTDIPEQDRGKRRPMFGSGYCTYCTKARACKYL